MLLNRFEYALMNDPVRAAIQRYFEARRLLRMGGAISGGRALEVFGAGSVDAFDLDPRMVSSPNAALGLRLPGSPMGRGDASAISVPDGTYDAVFDFGIIHHVPEWRRAAAEVHRALKPGGRIYAEEVLRRFIVHPITRAFSNIRRAIASTRPALPEN